MSSIPAVIFPAFIPLDTIPPDIYPEDADIVPPAVTEKLPISIILSLAFNVVWLLVIYTSLKVALPSLAIFQAPLLFPIEPLCPILKGAFDA